MTFGAALEAAKQGEKITREGWNGKGQFVFILDSHVIEGGLGSYTSGLYAEIRGISIRSCLCIKTAANEIQVGWLATQSDMLSEDWKVV